MRTLILAFLFATQALPVSVLSVTKTPFEQINLSMDFTPVAGADGITLLSVVSTNLATGQDSSSQIIMTSPVPAVVGSTDVVVFRVQAGANGQTHIVGVRVQDNVNGQIWEGQITLTINSGTNH